MGRSSHGEQEADLLLLRQGRLVENQNAAVLQMRPVVPPEMRQLLAGLLRARRHIFRLPLQGLSCLNLHDHLLTICLLQNCNDGGEEFLRRLSVDWKTAVHIALYDLSISSPKKFYSISGEIAPFMWDNWDRLNFPLTVSSPYSAMSLMVDTRSLRWTAHFRGSKLS